MATSVPRSSAPPPAKMLKHAPAAQAEDKPPGKLAFGASKTTQNHVFNASVEFPQDSASPLRSRISSLFATMQQGDPHLSVLPRNPNSKLNPITSGPAMPHDPDTLEQYVTKATIANNTIKVYVTFQASMPFARIKFAPHVFNYLSKFKIWLKAHSIRSDKVIPAVWLYNINLNYTSKFELTDALAAALPSDFPDFQINRSTIRYAPDTTLSTDAWCVEIDGTNPGKAFTTLLTTFPLSGPYGAVPMQSANDVGNKLRNIFLSHNAYLHRTTSIRVDNLRSLDVPLKKADGTTVQSIREEAHSWTTPDGKPVITSISQFNSKRVNFICDKQNEHLARNTLKTYMSFLAAELDSDFLLDNLCDSNPLVIGTNIVPNQISVFLQGINDINFPSFTMDDASLTTNKQPPNTRKRTMSYKEATLATETQTVMTESTHHPAGASEITQTTQSPSQTEYEQRIHQAMEAMRQRTTRITENQQTLTDHLSTITTQFEIMQKRFEDTLKHVATLQKSMDTIQTSMDKQFATIIQAINTTATASSTATSNNSFLQQYNPSLSTQPTQMVTDTQTALDPGENTRRQE